MKYILTVILAAVLSNSLFAQDNIHKVWIGEHHEYLDLRNHDTAYFANPGQLVQAIYYYNNGILSFPRSYAATGIAVAHEDKNAYKVVSVSKDMLELHAIDNAGHENNSLFQHKEKMVFFDSVILFRNSNQPFHFEKLYYEHTEWYTRQTTKVLIDSAGTVYSTYGNHASDDTSNIEYPKKGRLTKTQLNELVNILKKSDLNNFPTGYGNSGTANSVVFGFYFNNMQVISRGNVQLFPYLHINLLEYLKGIPNVVTLKQQYDKVRMGL